MSQTKSSRSKRKVLPDEISLSLKIRKSRQHLFPAESVSNNRNKVNSDNDTSNVKKSKKKKLRQTQNFLNLSGEFPEETSSSVSSISKSRSPGNSEIDGVVSSEVFLETEERPKTKKSKKKKIKLPSLNLNDVDGTDNTWRFSAGNTSSEKKNTSVESLSSTTDIIEDNTRRKIRKKKKELEKQSILQDAARTRSSRKRRVDKSENIAENSSEDKENINEIDLTLKSTSSSRKKMRPHEFHSIDNEKESEISIQQMNVKDTSGKRRRKKLGSTNDVEKQQMLSEELVGKQIITKDISGSTKKKRSRKLASVNDVENSETIVEQLSISNTVHNEEVADETEEKGGTRVKLIKTRKRRRMHDSEELIKSNKKTKKINVENSETSEADNLSDPQNIRENIINSKSRRTKLVDKQSDTPLKVNKRGKSSSRFKKSPMKEQDISTSSIENLEKPETGNTSSDQNAEMIHLGIEHENCEGFLTDDSDASQQTIFESKRKVLNKTPKDSRKSRKLPEIEDEIINKSNNRNSRTIRMSSQRHLLRATNGLENMEGDLNGSYVEEPNSENNQKIDSTFSDDTEVILENRCEYSKASRRSQPVEPKLIDEIADRSSNRNPKTPRLSTQRQSLKFTNRFETMGEDLDESYVIESISKNRETETINYNAFDEHEEVIQRGARLSTQMSKSNISGDSLKTPLIQSPQSLNKNKRENSRTSRRSWQAVDPKSVEEIANKSSKKKNSKPTKISDQRQSLKSTNEFEKMEESSDGSYVIESTSKNHEIANKTSKRHSETTKVNQSVKSTNDFERMEEDSDESYVKESTCKSHDTETINSSDEHEDVIQRGARLSNQMSKSNISRASLKTPLIQSPKSLHKNKRDNSRISRRSWQAVDPKTIEEIANKSSKKNSKPTKISEFEKMEENLDESDVIESTSKNHEIANISSRRHSETTKVNQSVKSTNNFERMEEDQDESYAMKLDKHHQSINYDSSDENNRISQSSARLSSTKKKSKISGASSKTPQISLPENIDESGTILESKGETSKKSRRSWQLVEPKILEEIANYSSDRNSRTSMSLKSTKCDQMVDDFDGTFIKSSCSENQGFDYNVSDQNEKSGIKLNTSNSRTPKKRNQNDSLGGFKEANKKSGKRGIISPNNLDGSEKVTRSSRSSNRKSRNSIGDEQIPTFEVTEEVEPSINRINLENPNSSIKTLGKVDMDFPWMTCASEDDSLDKQRREKKDSKRKRWTILNCEKVESPELASRKEEIVENADNVITEEVMSSNRSRRSTRKRWSTELKRMSLNPNECQKIQEFKPSISERVSRGESPTKDQDQNHSSMRWAISNASEVKSSEPDFRPKKIVEMADNEIIEKVVPSNRGRRSTRKRWSTELRKMSLNPNEFQVKGENEWLGSERMSGFHEQSHLSMGQSRSLDCLEGIAPLEGSSTLRHDKDQPNESQMDNTSKRSPTPPGSIFKRRGTYEVGASVTDISILKSLSEETLSNSRLGDEENDEETRKSVRFRHVTRRKPYVRKNDSPSSSEYKEPEPSPKKVPPKLKSTKKSVSFDHSLLVASTPITSSKKENLLKKTLMKNISEKRRSRSVEDNRSKVVSRIKMPNFSKIHQRWNNQLEDVTEMQARKAERARLLLSGQKPSTSNNSQKNNDRTDKHPRQLNFRSHQMTNNIKFGNPFTPELKKEASTAKQTEIQNNSKKLPAISTKNIIHGKFDTAGSKNFIAKSGIPKKLESKKPAANLFKRTEEIKSVATKTKPHHDAKEERRTILKGVRGNRRFELLMKMRNK